MLIRKPEENILVALKFAAENAAISFLHIKKMGQEIFEDYILTEYFLRIIL